EATHNEANDGRSKIEENGVDGQWSNSWFWFIFKNILLFASELALNYNAMLIWGDSVILNLLASGGLTLGIVLTSVYLGKVSRQRFADKPIQKWLVIGGVTTGVFGVLFILGSLRAITMGALGIYFSPWMVAAMGILLFLISTYIAFEFWPSSPSMIAETKAMHKIINNCEYRITELEVELVQIEQVYEKTTNEINNQYEIGVSKILNQEIEIINDMNTDVNNHNTLLASLTGNELVVDSKYKACLGIYESNNVSIRLDGKVPNYFDSDDELLKLTFRFDKEEFLPLYEIPEVASVIVEPDEEETDQEQPKVRETGKSKGKTNKGSTKAKKFARTKGFSGNGIVKLMAIMMLFLSQFLMSGCSEEPITRTNVLLVFDKTSSTHLSEEPSVSGVLQLMGIDNANTSCLNEGQVTTAIINQFSVNPTLTRVLEVGDEYGNPYMREIVVNKFSDDIQSNIDAVFRLPLQDSYSNIYQPLCRLVSEMKEANFDKNVVIIFSDLLQNNPETFSFYRDADWIATNPDKALELLETQCTLPDLTGLNLEIWIVFQPQTIEEDQLSQKAQKFFGDLFLSHNVASLKFRSKFDW
ncbi:DMT family transporter, partial [Bacteroidales bacterium AH-315-N07]|nr:DMT family transporter [Bacteroidales bacterium AH-315-N07]